jgi:[ribosomal protein S18]-alanine N-acetyltransferase
MQIRPYNISDKEKLIEILRLNIPDYFAPEEEMEFIDYLSNHSQNYYVLEIENKIVGCGGFNLFEEENTVRISWDIFHPEYRRKGLGSALTHFRLQEIMKNPKINIIVVRTSQLAYKFYEKFGFRTKEIINDYWAKGFHLYNMEFNINSIVIK